jgi:RHS repeat-associated protein
VTSVEDSAGGTVTSVYDSNNRLISRRYSDSSGNQLRIDLTYTPSGQIATETRYADTAGTQLLGKTQYTYDHAGNVTQIEHTNAAGTVLLNFQYQYDAGNRLTSETDTVNGTATTTNYTYDASNQLTSAGNTQYSYDPNGNRTMAGYQTGTGNELQSDGVWDFRYDPEGNLIEKDGISNGLIWKYAWDNANHLLTATEYNASTGAIEEQETNFWDVYGNLIEQDQYNASTGGTTVVKFANEIMGLSLGQQGTGGLAPVWAVLNSNNQVQTRRLYLNTVDTVLARIASGVGEGWYLTDHLGSIRALMNNSGQLIDTITYDAWGNPTDSNSANGDRFKFDGGQYDALTGLYQFGRREYSPADGNWMSQDPLGLSADSNPYRYADNSPTNAIDPSGEQFFGGMIWGLIQQWWANANNYVVPWRYERKIIKNLWIVKVGVKFDFTIQYNLTKRPSRI